MSARVRIALLAVWAVAEALLVWGSHENRLPWGSVAPGLGLAAGALLAAGGRRHALRVALPAASLAWLALSLTLFAHRDATLRAVVREALRGSPGAPAARGPNVLVVLADTLRRDHLSVYGHSRETSPRLAAFAEEAAVFERAFAQAPSTKPSVASLFTSRFPSQHRALHNEDALDPSLTTLAEVLQRAGYRTAGFVENPIVGAEFGYARGFEHWRLDARRHRIRDRDPGARMQDLDGAIGIWLRSQRQRSFFLYVHYIDPHTPYEAPDAYRGLFDGHGDAALALRRVGDAPHGDEHVARARYDEEIRYVDDRFARLVATLRELGLLDSTVTIFLSDHGEGFGEHGYVHHSHSVYSDLIDVPLLIRYPARLANGRHTRLAQHVDLAPTILDLAGVAASGLGFEGASLLAPPAADASVVVEHLRDDRGEPQRAVIRGRFKLVHHVEADRYELFDIESDPGDRRDLLHIAEPALLAELKGVLERHLAREGLPQAPRVEVPEATRRSLEALGYLR